MADNKYEDSPAIDNRIVTGAESEDQLLKKFDVWYQDSASLATEKKKWCDDNMDQYLGNFIKTDRASYKSNTVQNKQFENIETLVPNMTERPPEPIVAVESNKIEDTEAAQVLQHALLDFYRKDKLKMKSEQIIRDMEIYRDAVVFPLWDENKGIDGDITIENGHPDEFRIDPNATYYEQGEYFFKIIKRSYRWAVEHFPEEREKIKQSVGHIEEVRTDNIDQEPVNDSLVQIFEVWYWAEDPSDNNAFHIFKANYVQGHLLGEPVRNPFWDFEGDIAEEDEQTMQKEIETMQEDSVIRGVEVTEDMINEIMEPYKEKRRYRNFFDKERLPYILFPTYISNKKPYSITSKIEQTKYLQQSINKRKQQIDENANSMANGDWIVDAESGVDVKKLTNAPGLVVVKNKGTDVRREPGVPLPSYVSEDKNDSEQALDGIWGASNIIKGENPGSNVPARTSILLERNLKGRIAMMIGHFEAGMEETYAWVMHLMKLFYDEERTIGVMNDTGVVDSWKKVSSDTIHDNMQMYVKAGSAQPRDLEIIKADAKDLYREGLLDPVTYFRLTGEFPDPEEVAKRAWQWKENTLFDQPQPSIEDVTRDELQAILQGEQVNPNPDATEMTIQIQAEAMQNRAEYPFTEKQIDVLEQKMQTEMQMVKAQKQKALAERSQAMIPPDLQPPVPAPVEGEQPLPEQPIPIQ